MKKNILKVTLVTMFALFAGYNVYCSQSTQKNFVNVILDEVEAVAACEVSPNWADNRGNCTSDVNNSNAYCVSSAWGPACCKTI